MRQVFTGSTCSSNNEQHNYGDAAYTVGALRDADCYWFEALGNIHSMCSIRNDHDL